MPIGAERIYHVNSNCTDLERAARFYEALGLRRVVRTVPSRPQPGDAFGLAEVAWDAWMLQSDDGMDGLALDLLEWTTPGPTGTPPSTVGEPGLNRLVITTPDLDATVAAAVDAGGTLVGGPVAGHAGERAPRTAMVRDPDGVPVQLFEGERTSIAQVIVNVTDLDRAVTYYRDVLGLRVAGEAREADQPGVLHGLDADARVRVARVADAGSAFAVALVQWLDPAFTGAAHQRRANELGLFRMAWSTDDCERDEAVVRSGGSVPFAPTSELSVGDDLPLLKVLFWPGPDGECLELIQTTDRSGVLD